MESLSEAERAQSEDSSPELSAWEANECGLCGAPGGYPYCNASCEEADQDEDSSPAEPTVPDVTDDTQLIEKTAGKLVSTALWLLMEDEKGRGWLDLQRWLTSHLDKAYQGGGQ